VNLVAGVDSSTQSTKVVIVDAETGELVGSGTSPHVVTGSGGARESDPACWEGALASALAEALSSASAGGAGTRQVSPGDVAAISVGAQQHGLVVLDDGGRPVRPAVLWNDTRAVQEAADLVAKLGGPVQCARTVGSVLTPAFTAAKWAWLRRLEPASAHEARGLCLPHDYLTGLLTGVLPRSNGPSGSFSDRAARGGGASERSGLVTDRSDVSGTGWWSPVGERYEESVLAHLGISSEMLPRVLGHGEPAGEVPTPAAEWSGLSAGTVVGPGAGDNAAAALALGLEAGEAAVSLGTSGTVFVVAPSPSADPEGVVAGFASASGAYLPLVCTLNATVAVDRVAGWLGLSRDDVVPSGEVVFLPWLDGERTPNLPGASGILAGLRHDTDLRSVLQAAYEGAVAALLAGLERIESWATLREGAPLLLVGGGARSAVWRETLRRLSGRGVVVPEAGELVALGAAVQAAAVLEGVSPLEIAKRWHTRRGREEEALPRDSEKLGRILGWADAISPWAVGQQRPAS
jgi:xylulokinase